MRKLLLIVILSITFPVISLEIILRTVDPWGAHTYYSDLETLRRAVQPDGSRGYVLPAGHWDFRHWSITQTDDGRSIPDTHSAPCDVALLGDSVTFGFAVDDEMTFANRLAQRFPAVQFHNYGTNGYNTAQVAGTLTAVSPADVYVYLLISNDAEPPLAYPPPPSPQDIRATFRATFQYLYHWQATRPRNVVQAAETSPDLPTWFWEALTVLQQQPVIVAGIQGHALAQTVADSGYPITLIPHYHNSISYADPHPNVLGHQRLADGLTPLIVQAVLASCPDTRPEQAPYPD